MLPGRGNAQRAIALMEAAGVRVLPARGAVLDPLGAGITPGPDAWFELMRALANGLHACLSLR